MHGTLCSQIDNLGLFCSELLSVHGTHCSQIDDLGLFCSEFLSIHGTLCSQIDNLGPFCSDFPLRMERIVPKLGTEEQIMVCFVPNSYLFVDLLFSNLNRLFE